VPQLLAAVIALSDFRGGYIDRHCHVEQSFIPSLYAVQCDEILHFVQNDMVFKVAG
jgi:hypothetical protein